MRKLLLLIISLAFLVGCNRSAIEDDNFKLTDEIVCSSYDGIDFLYSAPDKDIWEKRGVFEDDCTYYRNNEYDISLFILKNIDEDLYEDETFEYNLQGKDIPKFLYDKIEEYTKIKYENIVIDNQVTDYVDEIKYYDIEGECEMNSQKYYIVASFFQSKFFIPDCYGFNAPTVFFAVYKDVDYQHSIKDMIYSLKESIIYDEY